MAARGTSISAQGVGRGCLQGRSPSPSGFTLTEMMVVILLVGVLAVVAVPIYSRYIQTTKASEAKAMIGAIVAAEKAYAERNGTFIAVSTVPDFQDKLRIDVRESGLFNYVVSAASGQRDRFTVTATVNNNGVKDGLPSGGSCEYSYDKSRDPNPRGEWAGICKEG